MDGVGGVTKTEQRVLTGVGTIVGLLVGFVVFQKVIGNRMIEAPKFVLAVFVGGVVGMILYTLIKDGGVALLKRRAAPDAAPPAPDQPVTAARRKEPLKAKKAAAPEPAAKPRSRPVKATRERPLRPPNR